MPHFKLIGQGVQDASVLASYYMSSSVVMGGKSAEKVSWPLEWEKKQQ